MPGRPRKHTTTTCAGRPKTKVAPAQHTSFRLPPALINQLGAIAPAIDVTPHYLGVWCMHAGLADLISRAQLRASPEKHYTERAPDGQVEVRFLCESLDDAGDLIARVQKLLPEAPGA